MHLILIIYVAKYRLKNTVGKTIAEEKTKYTIFRKQATRRGAETFLKTSGNSFDVTDEKPLFCVSAVSVFLSTHQLLSGNK